MLSGIRHLLRCRRHAGQHHLLLVDNLALALACPKGRGSSSLANRTCQQLCALALASDSKFHVRWIPSERNCADRPSREPWLKKARRSLVAHPSIVDGVGDKDFAAHGRASRASNQEEDMQDSRQRQCNRAHPGRRPFALGGEQGAPDLNPGSLQRRGGDLTDYDCLLTAYLNELYAQGADVSAAEYLLLPVPRLRQARHQGFGASHTGSRATATWPLRRCGSRLPAFAAIVGALLAHGQAEMALGLLLQWDLLLRPQFRCTGPRPLCSRTQKRHLALSGSSPQGVPWTKIAEPYPLRWAKAWAAVIIDSSANSIARRLASLVSII